MARFSKQVTDQYFDIENKGKVMCFSFVMN